VTPDRYTVAVDFDGVIHRYDTPFIAPHIIPDEPVTGAIEWLHRTLQKLDVAIMSTRNSTWRGRRAMRSWLKSHAGNLWYPSPGFRGLEEIGIPKKKPPALVYLDDRAIRFEGPGTFPTVDEIHRARPWHKA